MKKINKGKEKKNTFGIKVNTKQTKNPLYIYHK